MTSDSAPAWIQQIHGAWVKGAPAATARLRIEWRSIDEAALRQAAEWAEQGKAEDWQPRLSAATFDSVLRLLASTAGDPPVPAEVREASRAALRGPADEALIKGTDPLVRQLLPDLDEHLARIGDDEQRTVVRGVLAMVAACLALRRVEILRLLGQLSPAAEKGPDSFGDVLQAALDQWANEPERSEELLVQALEFIPLTSARDNLFVLRTILQREDRPLQPDTLRACVHRLAAMADAGTGGDVIAWDLGIVAARVNAGSLAPELFPALAGAGEALIGQQLSEPARMAAGLGAAQQWLRVGRLDRTDVVLWRLRQAIDSPACRLGTAVIESDARALCSDRPGARAVLITALDTTSSAGVSLGDRRTAVLHLLANWPVDLIPLPDSSGRGTMRPTAPEAGQQGIDYWINEAERLIDASEAWARNSLRVQLLASLYQLGAYDEAAALLPSVDFEAWRTSSADYKHWTPDIEEWARRQAAEATGQSGAAGDAGKDYTTLALEQRFPEAAALAESAAATSLERGFRVEAYGALVAAGRFHRLARDYRAALTAYERALTLLEHDLVYVPYAELVVSRLAAWPELYQLAAVTALQLDDPVRAVSLAETGRSRATGSRLGTFRHQRPDVVPEADWDEFCRLWRHAVADAANSLVRTSGPVPGSAASPTTDRINDLRRQFVQAGVPIEDIAPVGPPVDAASVLPKLASASRPTVVLYAIRVADVVRFVRLTADGGTEIRLEDTAQEQLTTAIDTFGNSVRSPASPQLEIGPLLSGLLAQAGPVLEPVLRQAADGFGEGRLIWIPQGTLAGLPLQAMPCGGGLLIDAVSVVVSPSLVSAITAMEPDAVQPLSTAAIQGTYRERQAPTDGGARVLITTGHPAPDEVIPQTLEQLNHSLADRSLVHLACHGHFHWDDPLTSTLQLGFDLSVGQLFDEVDFTPDSLVLLGTCDSGTIAQSDLNEGIGMPAGLIAAGARTVVGAGWPVAAPAAVGICRKFVEGLAAGLASPEALRQATRWIRDATLADLQQELAAISHPMAERIAAQSEAFRHSQAFQDPARWAAYLHWGGAWRTAS
jgi:CHAT domain-containing protein